MGLKENIKNKRIERKMTLEDLAKSVGVSRQTIQRYESGVIGNIPSDKIELIARALDTSPAYLMGWESASDEKTKDITSRSKEFEFPLNIRSAARDLMDLSDSDQELAINMIHSLAKKGRKANENWIFQIMQDMIIA